VLEGHFGPQILLHSRNYMSGSTSMICGCASSIMRATLSKRIGMGNPKCQTLRQNG
jgi:hypothetical protein